MARGRREDEYDVEGYTARQQAVGVGSTALTGAVAGGQVGGAYGALAGGIIGAGVGWYNMDQQEREYIDAQEQQNALNRELKSQDLYDRWLQQYNMQGAMQREEAMLSARQAAARGGLTPAAAASLEQQTRFDYDFAHGAGIPGVLTAAQQADLARRQQVLAEYETAQGLANNAAPVDYSAAFGQLAGAVTQYGTMNTGTAATSPPSTVQAQPAPVAAAAAAPATQQAAPAGLQTASGQTADPVWGAIDQNAASPEGWVMGDGGFVPFAGAATMPSPATQPAPQAAPVRILAQSVPRASTPPQAAPRATSAAPLTPYSGPVDEYGNPAQSDTAEPLNLPETDFTSDAGFTKLVQSGVRPSSIEAAKKGDAAALVNAFPERFEDPGYQDWLKRNSKKDSLAVYGAYLRSTDPNPTPWYQSTTTVR